MSSLRKPFGDSSARHPFSGLQQLISAALADPLLAEALIADPVQVLAQGLPGITLTPEEYGLVTQVRGTTSLDHFAAYLDALVQDAILAQEIRPEREADDEV